MALYYPALNLVIQIDDDPRAQPYDEDAFPGFDVMHVTCADIMDPDRFACIERTLAKRAGEAGYDMTPVASPHRDWLFRTLCGSPKPFSHDRLPEVA